MQPVSTTIKVLQEALRAEFVCSLIVPPPGPVPLVRLRQKACDLLLATGIGAAVFGSMSRLPQS